MRRLRIKNPIATATSGIATSLAVSAAWSQPGPPPVAAAETPPFVDEIVVVETRLRDDLFGIGEGASADASDLAATVPADAEQLFRKLPGFSVYRVGGPGGVSEVFLRGAESNFTAVYVDGVRLNNPSNTRGGSFDFSSLDIYGIERVDASAGAMSAVYGADAMAGVILIRSAWAEPGSPGVFVEAGSVNDWRVGAGASFARADDIVLSVRASAMDGGDEIVGSSLRLDNVGTRLAGRLDAGGSWQVSLRQVRRDRSSFPEVSGGPDLSINRELEAAAGDELSLAAELSWAPADRWESEIHLSAARLRDDAAAPAVAPGLLDGQPAFTAITRYERSQLLWINSIDLSPALHLVTGMDLVSEEGRDDGSVDLGFAVVPNAYRLDRSTSSAFAELGTQWNDRLTTSLAVRWDRAGAEERVSGKLGLTRRVSASGSRVWGRVANGFKLPSFFALGNPLFGNASLVAEKARSAEVGYTHEFSSGHRLIVSAFDSTYEDLVDFDFETFSSVNRGRIDIRGVQLRASVALSSTARLDLDGTWSDISSESGPLRRRPERTGGASLELSPGGPWRLSVTARYSGSRLLTSIPTGDVLGEAFTLVGATARYEHARNRSYWIAVDNVLDERYQEAPGFPSPGARVRVGMSVGL